MKRLTEKHTRSYERVRKWLQEHDPENLLDMGAPADEYDGEADFIAQYIDGGGLNVGDFCHYYWQGMFQPLPAFSFDEVLQRWREWAKELNEEKERAADK